MGIVGAGPAGCLAATLLVRAGHDVTLFERKPGREKACGGGFTARALNACSLPQSGVPATSITELELLHRSLSAILPLNAPFRIYSRAESDGYLMREAVAAGAVLQTGSAHRVRPARSGWEIAVGNQTFTFDWLIGADGTHSCVRAACSCPFELRDLSMTFGYYLPGKFHPRRAIVEFLSSNYAGYLWSFPRPEHSSVGVISVAGHPPTKILKRLVDEFLQRHYGLGPPARDKIYGAMVPTLRAATLRSNRCAGTNWALVGDAGGFVDPITGEGIYFALRSAHLLAQLAGERSLAEFDRLWRNDFGEELLRSARLKRQFYRGRWWRPSYTGMLIPLTRRSATVRRIESEFVSGGQGYVGLKRRIFCDGPRIVSELLLGR
ncbi:MAG: NAD(P)/FAD-dependent oxidoreductase [Acidobacteria bacterium]|nr:NAD(P)/FAD-dependent oxidoreductase [Acidobacteriota bacterium]